MLPLPPPPPSTPTPPCVLLQSHLTVFNPPSLTHTVYKSHSIVLSLSIARVRLGLRHILSRLHTDTPLDVPYTHPHYNSLQMLSSCSCRQLYCHAPSGPFLSLSLFRCRNPHANHRFSVFFSHPYRYHCATPCLQHPLPALTVFVFP